MNVYAIEGTEYRALNEYDALKQAYRVADSMEAAELMRFEGEWHNLAIWGDTRNQTWIPSCLRVEA